MIYQGEKAVVFPSGDLTLEGALFMPKGDCHGEALICHPHPALGGNMDQKVAVHLARALNGMNFQTLRFNFRGVGSSTGEHDEGRGEVGDVKSALAFLRAQAVGATNTVVAGYSFGSFTGLKGTFEDLEIDAWIAVAPPWEMFDFSFLHGFHSPLLMMVGEDDPVCSPSDARRLVGELNLRAEIVERPGADHLFHGSRSWFRDEIQVFLSRVL